eukprot:Gb_13830 [translate_table: standard]
MANHKDEQVKLLGESLSPYVMRVRIALKVKGVDYEYVEESMQNKSQLLLQSNPVHKMVPVLIHNGKPICESLIIVEYIDDTWSGPRLMPAHPYDRATARFWAAFVDDKINGCVQRIFGSQGEQQRKAVEESWGTFGFLEEALRTTFCGKPFCGGDGIGTVDMALGSMLGWIEVVEKMSKMSLVNAEKTPLLSAWAERFCELESVKEVIPDPLKLWEFASAMRSTIIPSTAN